MIEALKCNLDLEYFVKLMSWRYLTGNLRLKVRTIRIYSFPSSHPEDSVIFSSEDFLISQIRMAMLKTRVKVLPSIGSFQFHIKILRNFLKTSLPVVTFDRGFWWIVFRKLKTSRRLESKISIRKPWCFQQNWLKLSIFKLFIQSCPRWPYASLHNFITFPVHWCSNTTTAHIEH